MSYNDSPILGNIFQYNQHIVVLIFSGKSSGFHGNAIASDLIEPFPLLQCEPVRATETVSL